MPFNIDNLYSPWVNSCTDCWFQEAIQDVGKCVSERVIIRTDSAYFSSSILIELLYSGVTSRVM